jgi:serine/threonine-protein kinase
MSSAVEAIVGKTIAGRYRIVGLLGEGAMAVVYRGEQDEGPSPLAIKVMHAHLAVDRTFSKRFEREAKAAARLNHPNTVRIVDYGMHGSLAFIAMELLEGQDLFDVLARERRLSEARAAQIVIQACDALGAAHDLGIVHRDLKPENVMLLGDPGEPGGERVKVLDFGIAKIVERTVRGSSDEPPSSGPSSALTTVGVVVGTPAYMSPEQCRGEAIDGRSDVYACGVLLYQLVTGRTPFVGESPIDVAMAHVREEPPPPSTFAPGITAGLEAVILKALGKLPAERQQTARELSDELVALLPTLATTPRRAASPQADEAAAAAQLAPALSGVPRGEVRITSTSPSPSEAAHAAPPPAAPRPADSAASSAFRRVPTVASQRARAGAPVMDQVPPWVLLPVAVLIGAVIGVFVFLLLR